LTCDESTRAVRPNGPATRDVCTDIGAEIKAPWTMVFVDAAVVAIVVAGIAAFIINLKLLS
jgi:hypothetical protein